VLSKLKSVDMREYTLDQVHIPRMYFQEQPTEFDNKRDYLSEEFKNYLSEQTIDHDEVEEGGGGAAGEENSSVNNAGPSNAAKRSAELLPTTTRDQAKRLRNA
jgi:hypothetical protein